MKTNNAKFMEALNSNEMSELIKVYIAANGTKLIIPNSEMNGYQQANKSIYDGKTSHGYNEKGNPDLIKNCIKKFKKQNKLEELSRGDTKALTKAFEFIYHLSGGMGDKVTAEILKFNFEMITINPKLSSDAKVKLLTDAKVINNILPVVETANMSWENSRIRPIKVDDVDTHLKLDAGYRGKNAYLERFSDMEIQSKESSSPSQNNSQISNLEENLKQTEVGIEPRDRRGHVDKYELSRKNNLDEMLREQPSRDRRDRVERGDRPGGQISHVNRLAKGGKGQGDGKGF